MNMTTGHWRLRRRNGEAHRNEGIIRHLRAQWRALQHKRPREVRVRHVRSHTKVPGNEGADWLANLGMTGTRSDSARDLAQGWLQKWLQGKFPDARRGEGSRAECVHHSTGDG